LGENLRPPGVVRYDSRRGSRQADRADLRRLEVLDAAMERRAQPEKAGLEDLEGVTVRHEEDVPGVVGIFQLGDEGCDALHDGGHRLDVVLYIAGLVVCQTAS